MADPGQVLPEPNAPQPEIPAYPTIDAQPPPATEQPPAGSYPPPQTQPGYPQPQAGYPPQQSEYPPQQSEYPPQQMEYPPQEPGYPPQQTGYPPQQPAGYPPQPQQGYPPPTGYPQAPQHQSNTTTTVVVTQPAPTVLPTPVFRDHPVTVVDSNGQQVQTVLRYRAGTMTWLICCLICWVTGGCWIIALIPCCISSCKDVVHITPTDGKVVGVYHRC